MNDVVILADKSSINGTLDAQLLLQSLGVTFQVGVGLFVFVKEHQVILRWREGEKSSDFSVEEEKMMGPIMTCMRFSVYLDHVKVMVVGEDGVHLTVQLFEVVLDGVGLQHVASSILMQEVVACKTRKTLREAATDESIESMT